MWKLFMGRPRALAAGLALVITGGGCGGGARPEPSGPIVSPELPGLQCGKWGFEPPKQGGGSAQLISSTPGDDCEPDQCGLNGMWFGQGLRFRELDLTGEPNAQGLALVGAVAPGRDKVLQLGIERDELLIRDLSTVGNEIVARGEAMKGAVILLESATQRLPGGTKTLFTSRFKRADLETVPLQFKLQILGVERTAFWSCAGGADCGQAFHYRFLASTNADGGCGVEVCDPKLARYLPDTSIQGTAVVFAGDVYDERSFGIESDNPGAVCRRAPPSTAKDRINIACTGTVVSKLHLLGHTAASMTPEQRTTLGQRQAMLRMLTADYCGIGHAFTKNRTPIHFTARGASPFQGYAPGAGEALEAVWTDRGASCIGAPRHADYERIASVCKAAGVRVPPRCAAATPDPSLLAAPSPLSEVTDCAIDSGRYLMSSTPAP
jgi:hypothetical protein